MISAVARDETTSQSEMHKSSLITHGIPGGDTAMAHTQWVSHVQGMWHPSVCSEVFKGLEEISLGLTETRR